MVPKGWTVKTVGDLFDVQLGKMLNQGAKEKHPQYKYLGNANVQWSKFNLDDLKTMHFSQNELKKFELKKNDILMCEGGEVGRCAIWNESDEPIYYQKALHRLRGKGNIEPEFFQNYMAKIAGTKLIDNIATKTSITHLTQEKLIQLPVKLPPIAEQKKIAQIFSTWDKSIATTEKLLENSQKQKRALMQQLLTGKKRLDGFSDDWKDTKLKSLLKEGKLRNQDLAVDRVLSVTNHSGFVLPEDQFSKRVASDDVSNYKIVKRGQYGYNPSRLNVGSFARLDDYEIGVLSPMYVVFSLNEDKFNSDYFYNWMQSNEAKQRIKNSTQGSVRDSVGFEALAGFSIKLPSLGEQEKIASILNLADKEIQTLDSKLVLLKKEKKALMQQLLTGKCRVKVEV